MFFYFVLKVNNIIVDASKAKTLADVSRDGQRPPFYCADVTLD